MTQRQQKSRKETVIMTATLVVAIILLLSISVIAYQAVDRQASQTQKNPR